MEAVEAATCRSGSPGDPDSSGGRRKPLGLVAKLWCSVGPNCRPFSSHGRSTDCSCTGHGACSPVGWMDNGISGVLRVLNNVKLFVSVCWSAAGVVSGDG